MALSGKVKSLYALLGLRTILFAAGPAGYVALVKNGADPYTTIAFILLTGGIMTITLLLLGLITEKERSVSELESGNLLLVLGMAMLVACFYILYALSMQRETIIETTIMARLSVLLAIPLSIWFLGTLILSWKKLLLGYIGIFSGVVVYKWQDIEHLLGAGGFGIVVGLGIALFGAAFDTSGTYLSKFSKLPVAFCTGLAMSIGGIGLLVMLKVLIPTSDLSPSLSTLAGSMALGFLTIAIPHFIASSVGRELNQPILVAASTFVGLIVTALLAFVWHDELLRIAPLTVMVVLLALGLYFISQAEEQKGG